MGCSRDEPRSAGLVVVAHPDDETLWAGGMILMHPEWDWHVATVCRASDPDRAPKFRCAARCLGARASMADLDDGPDQAPLSDADVRDAIDEQLTRRDYDLVLTHGPNGEYTRHRRHEEVSRAVRGLWAAGAFDATELRMFAYEDGGRSYLPRAAENAHVVLPLEERIWFTKREIIEDVYGFAEDSFEARCCPRTESFWCFRSQDEVRTWCERNGGAS